MTNIFILHSLNGDTAETWGIDVQKHFREKAIDVTIPNFPIRADSTYERFAEILNRYLASGELSEDSIIVAHSIGNAYFLRFAKEHNFKPKAYVAVAPGAVYNYPTSRTDYILKVREQAFVKQDAFDYMKNLDCKKYCLYSDEEDGNKEKFTRFVEDAGAEGIYLKGYSHFDGRHNICKVPELNELINELL